jgi:uncharacterized protein YkwD
VQELAEAAVPHAPLPYRLVEFAMQRHGIVEPAPHLVVVWGPPGDTRSVAEKLSERLPSLLQVAPFARFGVGSSGQGKGGEAVTILALQTSFIETSPIPRALPAEGEVRIQGRVLDPYGEPELFVTSDRGAVERAALTKLSARTFRARLSCSGRRGQQQVEITASDASGSAVLANFPLWCGTRPPDHLTVSVASDEAAITTSAQAEARLADLVNRDRVAAGLPALSNDTRLAAVARAHSEEMAKSGIVAHISPRTGSAADRVRRASITASVVLENVARAYGISEAEEGLMDSPGHRANILSDQVNSFGMGVVFGEEATGHRRELFVTQLFTRAPVQVDTETAARRAHEIVQRNRKLTADRDLEEIASGLAVRFAGGMASAQVSVRAAAELQARRSAFQRVTTVVTALSELDAFDPKDALRDQQVTHYGLGLARGDHPELGAGALYIVLLLGQK